MRNKDNLNFLRELLFTFSNFLNSTLDNIIKKCKIKIQPIYYIEFKNEFIENISTLWLIFYINMNTFRSNLSRCAVWGHPSLASPLIASVL